jgi:hypothetical protein
VGAVVTAQQAQTAPSRASAASGSWRGSCAECLEPAVTLPQQMLWQCPHSTSVQCGFCSTGTLSLSPDTLLTTHPPPINRDQVLVRYYVRPEQTHIGRQRHHGARELFLGTQVGDWCGVVWCGVVWCGGWVRGWGNALVRGRKVEGGGGGSAKADTPT